MHSEGFDLIGAFLCLMVFVEGDIPVFLTSYYRQWQENYLNTFVFFIFVKHGLSLMNTSPVAVL